MAEEKKACPYCGKPMLNGHIRARDKLTWSGKEHGTVDLGAGGPFPILSPTPAWYCPDCKKVMMDTQN